MSVTRAARPSLMPSIVIASRYMPVWIALGLLFVVAQLIAPATFSRVAVSTVLLLTSFLAIAALGEMLVIMTGGIDLSVPGVMTLAAMVIVGVAGGSDDGLALALLASLAAACIVGLANGVGVGVLKLNPLIVTLATGQIVNGITIAYATGMAGEAAVPALFASWVTTQFLGANWIFWAAALVTVLLSVIFRSTGLGRKFQAVGANPQAAWILGIRVNAYVVAAYVTAGALYGLAGILLAGFIRSPTLVLGAPYLLGPIAAVVIGGASLTGGLASPLSTWGAAFFLTMLSQMLRVLGLPSALQFVVFGAAIVGGMVISGDRIISVAERLLRNRTPVVDSSVIPRADIGSLPTGQPVGTDDPVPQAAKPER